MTNIFLSYDVLNRLTNMVDAVGTTIYSYDQIGQLLSESGPWGSDSVNYVYVNRLRTAMNISAPKFSAMDAEAKPMTWLGRLTEHCIARGNVWLQLRPGSVATRRYFGFARLRAMIITNTYDNVARLTLTELLNARGSNLDSYAYGYNQASQRTNVVRTAGDSVNYSYDNDR